MVIPIRFRLLWHDLDTLLGGQVAAEPKCRGANKNDPEHARPDHPAMIGWYFINPFKSRLWQQR